MDGWNLSSVVKISWIKSDCLTHISISQTIKNETTKSMSVVSLDDLANIKNEIGLDWSLQLKKFNLL